MKSAGTQAAIDLRRLELRGGRSVRQVSRDQKELDLKEGEWRPIRNRMSWAKEPLSRINRMQIKKTSKAPEESVLETYEQEESV